MRVAGCNSDHRLLRAKFVVGSKRFFRNTQSKVKVRRWDVQGECTDEQGELTTKGRYLMTVDEMMRNNWSDDSSIQEKWNTLKRALSDAAEADLGEAA